MGIWAPGFSSDRLIRKLPGRAAKGMAKTGKTAKGAANWQAGVMETKQDFLLAFQQEVEALKGVSNGSSIMSN